MKKVVNILLVIIPSCWNIYTTAWEQCNEFLCPTGNTCCPKGCIPNDMGSYNATCCHNDTTSEVDGGMTGCAVGYKCIDEKNHGGGISSIDRRYRRSSLRRASVLKILSATKSNNDYFCLANEKEAPMADDFVNTLPRYQLCRVPYSMSQLYGFGIGNNSTTKLGYYSSHGNVQTDVDESMNTSFDRTNVGMVLIIIHGSGRNADDYFCSALAAAELQKKWSDVWVIVPRFFDDTDHPPKDFLYWKTDDDDGDGTWRYGANSANGGTKATNGISSYTALDEVIKHTWMIKLPNLKQIVIAGHSSGGQFVNRWSLMTQVWADDNPTKMRSVVANPSSFIYLTPKRWIEELKEWQIPSSTITKNCPHYNQWEWGLDDGGPLHVPYRDEVFQHKSQNDIIDSFRRRKVIYLSGSLDLCPGDDNRSIKCHSHGIETKCMDELQGKTRFQRSQLYMKSLTQVPSKSLEGWKNHEHRIVHGVGHDHSLMWTASIGIDTLFGDI